MNITNQLITEATESMFSDDEKMSIFDDLLLEELLQ